MSVGGNPWVQSCSRARVLASAKRRKKRKVGEGGGSVEMGMGRKEAGVSAGGSVVVVQVP